jgi:phosphoribosylaminoimidazole (AIR) synthetase
MGVGMVIVCSPADAETIKTHLQQRGETCYTIGEVVDGNGEVRL